MHYNIEIAYAVFSSTISLRSGLLIVTANQLILLDIALMALTVDKIRVSTFFLLVFVNLQPSALSAPQVPCFFIFGDSLVDSGNNNDLPTLAKVDYPPYGIDFRKGPTGRFTNGGTTADFLGELLGFDDYIPPFATAEGNEIIRGVNYASGSAGIRDETGEQLGVRINLNNQLKNHNVTITRIAGLLGSGTPELLNKCLYYFVIGSNDYINNYLVPEYYPTSRMYTPEQYATVLVQQYSQHFKTLYGFGARKVAVNGIGPVGCAPAMLARGTNGSACVDWMNKAVQLFNDKLKLLVDDFNTNITDAKFLYLSAMDLRPTELIALGIRFLSKPCCKVSNTTGLCIPGETPCPIRALHAFYDAFHPSEIVNRVVAVASYIELLKLLIL
ncbi:GDSL esterase/lipase [Sesamum angolense]|uniref:GDSL esterase/lipase n=1 Tax=Sesamum angolense TaxID=2727404 RepID=A0AAE1W9Y0_9LAMI|nr:GDSL esterase/lipase [Sesamum angolense]